MPAHGSPAKRATSTSQRSARTTTSDAIKLLTEDHKEVKALFKQYDKLAKSDAEDDEKQQLAQEICAMLTAHASVEEEIFYPAAREALGEEADLIDEADVEHATAKELIAQIEASSPDEDDHYDAKVKVLGEYIDHHVKEEEGEIFPKVKKSLDVEALGEEIETRKQELLSPRGGAHS